MICKDHPTLSVKDYLDIITYWAKPKKGELVQKLENEFKKFLKVDYAVAFPWGRTALMALYNSLGKKGEIITTSYACYPVGDTIEWTNNKPVFVDISLKDYNMKISEIKKKINKKTIAISAVHLYGLPMDMDELIKIKEKNNLILIEDAALAINSEYKGKKIGSFGDASMFSFERSKIMTSYCGGIITTNSKKIYENLLKEDEKLRKSWRFALKHIITLMAYDIFTSKWINPLIHPIWKTAAKSSITKNYLIQQTEEKPKQKYLYKYPGIQAMIALNQFKKIDYLTGKRRENARYYDKNLSNIDWLVLPEEPSHKKHIYAKYTVIVNKGFKKGRDWIKEKFLKKGIQLGTAYDFVCPLLPYYKNKYYYTKKMFPNACIASRQILNLPVYPKLSKKDGEKIVNELKSIKKG